MEKVPLIVSWAKIMGKPVMRFGSYLTHHPAMCHVSQLFAEFFGRGVGAGASIRVWGV